MRSCLAHRPTRPGPFVALALFVALTAHPVPAWGQEPAGSIQAILDVRGGGEGTEIVGATERALVRPGGTGEWTEGMGGLPLFRQDQVMVEPRTVVRLSFRTPDAEATAHLSAELESPSGPFVVESIGGAGRALFEIRDDPEELGRMALTVARGSMVLDWVRGQVVFFAVGWRVVVSGTRLVVTVSEDGEQGLVHLVEGSVDFPDAPEFQLAPGESALLQLGVPPLLVPSGGALSPRLAEAGDWSAAQAWPGGGGTSPWLWVGGAAGAVAAGFLIRSLIRSGNGNGGSTQTGTVIFGLPF